MKQLALTQLQESIKILNYTISDINANTVENAKEDIKNALLCINAAIYSETPSTGRKFDLYKIVSNDASRPVMGGVFHNNGFKVASDCRVLVAVKETYDEALEGHILDKTGKDITGKYPKWQDLFPKKEDGEVYQIDTEKVYDLLKAVKAERKAAGKWGNYRRGYVKVGEAFFDVEIFAKLATFMDAYGCKEICVQGSRYAALCDAPDGSKAIIMPVVFAKHADEMGYQTETACSALLEENKDLALWYIAA